MAQAKSRITVSFDGWKADNEVLDLLGIMAHYIDKEYEVKTITLALRDTFGSHSGVNIKDQLLDVLREYQISNKVAFFAANNATNNDKALQLLAGELNIDAKTQRLRCLGHVINLVSTAILYSVDADCVEEVLEAVKTDADVDSSATDAFKTSITSSDEATRLAAWRKKDPFGKVYLLIVHIKHSNLRRTFFESKQREAAATENAELYRVVLNGGVRWNSDFDMLVRALKLRDALSLYQEHFLQLGEMDAVDCLTTAD